MTLRLLSPASVRLLGATVLLGALMWRFAPRPWDVLGALAGVDIWILVAAVAVNAAGVAVRAEAWRGLLGHVTADRVPFRDAFSAYVVGLVGNAVLPARAGEAARINMLGRRLSGERAYSLVTGSVVAHRLLDCIPFALLMLAVPLLDGPAAFSGVALGVAAIALISAAGLAIIIVRRRDPAFERTGRIGGAVAAMRRGAAGLGAPRTTARALVLETLAWVAQLTVVWLALAAFQLPASIGAAALILVAINVAVAVPLLPGGVGLFQAATALSLGAGGTAAAAGVGFGVGLQGLEILTTLLVGLPLAAREGLLLRRFLPVAAVREHGGNGPHDRHERYPETLGLQRMSERGRAKRASAGRSLQHPSSL